MTMRWSLLVLLWLTAPVLAAAADSTVADPTRPPLARSAAEAAAPTAAPALELSAVLISAERTVAVINGQPLQVGERLGDARVEAIRPDAVVLRHNGEMKVIPLMRRPLKTAVGATR